MKIGNQIRYAKFSPQKRHWNVNTKSFSTTQENQNDRFFTTL